MDNEKTVADGEKFSFADFIQYLALTILWYIAIGALSVLSLSKFFDISLNAGTIIAMSILLFVAHNTFDSKKG